jgi:two-component system sensor histidine kinase ChiS
LHDPAAVSLRRIDRVLVQGKSQPVVLYEVLDAPDLSIRQAKQRALADFEKGESLYEARDFSGAIGHLERALVRNPSDTFIEVLLERARRFSGMAEA